MYPLNSKQTFINAVIVLSLAVILISACAGGTTSPGNRVDEGDESAPSKVDSVSTLFPYPPPLEKVGPVDGNLNPDSVIIDGSQVVPFDDSPSGYGVRIMGTIPTPCHRILVDEDEPDDQDQIFIDLYAVSNPDEICIQVIEVFDITIPLEVYDPDVHTIWVNGEKAGQ